MMRTQAFLRQSVLLLALAMPAAGCAAAAVGAAAGAAGGVYLTTRGAQSLVDASIDQTAARTQSVMKDFGIVPDASSSSNAGEKREFKGKKGDLDVTVTLESRGASSTHVEATARKNLAEWDKNFAQDLVTRIVKAS
ncbi:MAG TPA: hypothetical protein VHR41_14790 [Gemmatimonadales bacterium]|jgi:hypothetical protein|nr:hypothetical protein [Gemmatimonadales bacterium]